MLPDGHRLRLARPGDAAAVSALFERGYAVLLAPDYPGPVLRAALPVIARANPALLRSGTWFVVESAGTLRAAGGWSAQAPGGGGITPGTGHIRHVVTDPAAVRLGLGRRVLEAALSQAAAQGIGRMECLSTLTAVPFYASLGFVIDGDVTLRLSGDIGFPATRMHRRLP